PGSCIPSRRLSGNRSLAYRIQFTRDGLKDAKALPRNVKNSLARELKAILARNPTSSSEALREPRAARRMAHFPLGQVPRGFQALRRSPDYRSRWNRQTFITRPSGHLQATGGLS